MPRKTEEEIVEEAVVDPRQAKWDAFLETYAVANPVKFAQKKAAGEFNVIPDSFN